MRFLPRFMKCKLDDCARESSDFYLAPRAVAPARRVTREA